MCVWGGGEWGEGRAMGRHVMVCRRRKTRRCLVMPFEQQLGFRRSETRLGLNRGGHHLIAVTVEQFSSIPRPKGLHSAFSRNLRFAPRAGERSHVYLHAT